MLKQIGFLALPYALRQTGWFGLAFLVGFGLIMTYTALLFGRSRRKFPLENFSDHVEVVHVVYIPVYVVYISLFNFSPSSVCTVCICNEGPYTRVVHLLLWATTKLFPLLSATDGRNVLTLLSKQHSHHLLNNNAVHCGGQYLHKQCFHHCTHSKFGGYYFHCAVAGHFDSS